MPFLLSSPNYLEPILDHVATSQCHRTILRTFRPPEGGGFRDPRWETLKPEEPDFRVRMTQEEVLHAGDYSNESGRSVVDTVQ